MRLSAWIEANLQLPTTRGTAEPIVLSPLQREVLDKAEASGARQTWLVWPKRSGKSLLLACRAVRELVEVPNALVVCLGPSERQAASVLFAKARAIAAASVRGLELGSTFLRNPRNNAEVRTLSASEESVQGITPTLILLDEVHEVAADHAFAATTQLGGAHRLLLAQSEAASVWVSSMLGSRSGLTYATKLAVDAGERPEVFLDYRSGEGASCELNPTLSPLFVEQQRRALLSPLFATYFLNEPGETASALFAAADLDAARARAAGYTLPLTLDAWQRLQGVYGAAWCRTVGVDRAMSAHHWSDRTALVLVGRPQFGFAAGEHPIWILGVSVLPTGHTGADILEQLRAWRGRFGPFWRTCLESYQCADLEQSARLYRPELVHPTPATQMAMFTSAANTAREGRLYLPGGEPGDYLHGELSRLQVRLRADLTARFEAASGKDDSAFAFGLALHAMRDRRVHALTNPERAAEARELREAEASGDTAELAARLHEHRERRRHAERFERFMYRTSIMGER